jgi:vacuolar iron transporter family protein
VMHRRERVVALQLMARDPLTAHARDEPGISRITTARPVQAALTSAVMFSVGAAMHCGWPRYLPTDVLVPIVSAASLADQGDLNRWCRVLPVAPGA